MEEIRNVFRNISPIDHRYSQSESDVFVALVLYLSEEAVINSCVSAEIALIKAHLTMRGELTQEYIDRLNRVASQVKPNEVYI